jgi:hypothetical protein
VALAGVEINRMVMRARQRLADALRSMPDRVDARGRLSVWGRRVQALRAGRRGFSTAAMLALLLALALAGTGAAVLAAGDNADAVLVDYTIRSVTVTTPARTQTYEVIRTQRVPINDKGKPGRRSTVRTRTVTGQDSVTTLRDVSVLPGQVEQLPGQTTTVVGPSNTVTVAGPGQTVTQVLTEAVTVTNEVVVTVTETVCVKKCD